MKWCHRYMQSIHTKPGFEGASHFDCLLKTSRIKKVFFLNHDRLLSVKIDILTEINTSVRRPAAAATSEAIPWMVGAYLQAFLRGRSEEQ